MELSLKSLFKWKGNTNQYKLKRTMCYDIITFVNFAIRIYIYIYINSIIFQRILQVRRMYTYQRNQNFLILNIFFMIFDIFL